MSCIEGGKARLYRGRDFVQGFFKIFSNFRTTLRQCAVWHEERSDLVFCFKSAGFG